MCFYNDYDWYASLQSETEGPAESDTRCLECGQTIKAGQWRRYIFMQEEEECQRCELEELEPHEEPCVEHDYGEVYEYQRCETCDKILRAVRAVEVEEGCPPDEQQPALEDMRQSLLDIKAYEGDAAKYVRKALEMFPELESVEWLGELATPVD